MERREGFEYLFSLGMNDYASIILYIMREESLAYICFCSIMKRIRGNFAKDGVVMATKFHRLKVLLRAIDPDYWNFLESCDAGRRISFIKIKFIIHLFASQSLFYISMVITRM